MFLKISLLLKWFYLIMYVFTAATKITYFSVEHPKVTYYNPKYTNNVTISSRRHGRNNPVHYFNLGGRTLCGLGNNLSFDFYFYEWLTNRYKRSFVEMHYKTCDMVERDVFFGTALRKNLPGTCPYPAGYYYLSNMTVPPAAIPKSFPFTKGRIYCNATINTSNEPFASGYIDLELRNINIERKDLLDN